MKNPLEIEVGEQRLHVGNFLAFGASIVIAVFFAAACDRTGPKPVNKQDGGELKHSIPSGQTGTGGVKNRDNTSEDAGKGVSGTRRGDD